MLHAIFVVLFFISLFAWIVTVIYAFIKKEIMPMLITALILNIFNVLVQLLEIMK